MEAHDAEHETGDEERGDDIPIPRDARAQRGAA